MHAYNKCIKCKPKLVKGHRAIYNTRMYFTRQIKEINIMILITALTDHEFTFYLKNFAITSWPFYSV